MINTNTKERLNKEMMYFKFCMRGYLDEYAKLLNLPPERLIWRQAPLCLADIKEMHKGIASTDYGAGRFRREYEWISLNGHERGKPDGIAERLENEIATYYRPNWHRHLVQKLAQFYGEFLAIYPFRTHNEEIAVLCANKMLLDAQCPPLLARNSTQRRLAVATDKYLASGRLDALVDVMAKELLESIHRYTTKMQHMETVKLSDYCRDRSLKNSAMSNRALRQTIPAFRQGRDWFIAKNWDD